MKITEFRIKLYPKDFAKIREFYEKTLGFQVVNEWDKPNNQGVMFDVDGTILELLTPQKGYQPIVGADLSLEVIDVHKLWTEMKDTQTIIHAIRDNAWGDTSFRIADPEGFNITFFTRHK